jgi:hypothetical protein
MRSASPAVPPFRCSGWSAALGKLNDQRRALPVEPLIVPQLRPLYFKCLDGIARGWSRP